MRNKYRVDRATDPDRVPCGMNSIVYMGSDWRKAQREFGATATGLDWWGRADASYGLLLSVWDESKRDYVVKARRGVTIPNMHGTYNAPTTGVGQ